ncbi:glycerate kinase [Streptococcus agalactiae]|nr:glycerate kinase [Streptococcus agalactiae]
MTNDGGAGMIQALGARCVRQGSGHRIDTWRWSLDKQDFSQIDFESLI